ncbi:MAG: LD-carboxypeptidase [Bdellovibrionales bacterium]|nr:LD-carboxypeptidase [Bdellovibrionales bacterium]
MFLKEKDCVFIVAPASKSKDNKWKKGIKILESWGLKVYFKPSMIKAHLFHSNSHLKRSFFLKQAFGNTSYSAVWMLRGGYGSQKLIPNFKKLNFKKSKLFVGYSDGTALHLYLNAKNQKSLHAPTLSELSDLSSKELEILKNVLFGKKKKLHFNKLRNFKSYRKKLLKGKITGGNLSLLSTSRGTFTFPPFEFLFLEDINEEAYKVDRFLHHLLYSGALKLTKAILFGDFYPLSKKDFQKVLKSFSQSCNLPLISNLPCGHKRKTPLPFNTDAQLSLENFEAHLTVSSL